MSDDRRADRPGDQVGHGDDETAPLDLPANERPVTPASAGPPAEPPRQHASQHPPAQAGPPAAPPWPSPPPYPGWGAAGWHGSGPPPRPPGWQPGYPPPRPPGYAAAPAQHRPGTPWPALIAVSLVVGLLGGVLGTLAALTGSDDGRGFSPRPNSSTPVDSDPAPLPANNTSVAEVADRLLPSVVQIRVDNGDDGATGSGFVLDMRGHVVTNAHVLSVASDDSRISVVLPDQTERRADLIGTSDSYDLAVLEVRSQDLTAARLGSSRALQVGQPVVAFGSPLGLNSTVTSGIVSALDRPVTAGGGGGAESYINAVQTDAAINPGNSGGPLVDMRGRVVGVNSAIATVGGSVTGGAGNIGVGFAIPIDQVRLTVTQLVRTGRAVYPVIGASVQTGGDEGALINKVNADSPAEKAGLSDGDVVVRIDGQPVSDGIELIVAIRARVPGDTVVLDYVRDDERRTTEVVLAEQEG